MNNDKSISVIIPVYNAEETISGCIESVLGSLDEKDEVIIVNDGSYDGTENICMEYANNNKNIKYIYQNNGGPFSARISGLKNANGEYISFIDADDMCSSDRYINIHRIISQHSADIYFFEANIKKVDGEIEIRNIDTSIGYHSKKEIYEQYGKLLFGRLHSDSRTCAGYLWNTLIKKDILDELTSYGNEEIRLLEDEIILIIATLRAESIYVSGQNLYTYDHSKYNSASKKRDIGRDIGKT